MATVTIRHTHADGTLIEGTTKGDGVWDVLKPLRGWRYFPSIRTIGIGQSRDQAAKRYQIKAGAEALRAAGFEVLVEIDDTPRAHEQVREDKAERLEHRAERLGARAERLGAEAAARFAAADAIAARFAFGQPILVGHHSERGARADQRRIENHMDKGCEAAAAARASERAAKVAGRGERYRSNPRVTAERIERAEAELRGVARSLEGYSRNFRNHAGEIYHVETHGAATGTHREGLLARQAVLEEQCRYDREALAEARAAGALPHSKDTIHKGDRVAYWGGFRKVVRVNAKTVSVETDYTWTDKVPYTRIEQVECGHGTPESDGDEPTESPEAPELAVSATAGPELEQAPQVTLF